MVKRWPTPTPSIVVGSAIDDVLNLVMLPLESIPRTCTCASVGNALAVRFVVEIPVPPT